MAALVATADEWRQGWVLEDPDTGDLVDLVDMAEGCLATLVSAALETPHLAPGWLMYLATVVPVMYPHPGAVVS